MNIFSLIVSTLLIFGSFAFLLALFCPSSRGKEFYDWETQRAYRALNEMEDERKRILEKMRKGEEKLKKLW